MANGEVAETNHAGLIDGLSLGSTRLVARAIGVDRITGKKISYSEDHVDVHIVRYAALKNLERLSFLSSGSNMKRVEVKESGG